MKKASKRLYEPRYTPNSSLSKSKAFVSLRPQRTMTTPSEATNQPLNSTPQMESKISSFKSCNKDPITFLRNTY